MLAIHTALREQILRDKMYLSLHPDVHHALGADPPGSPGWVRAAAGRRWEGEEGRMSSLVAARASAGMNCGLGLFPVCHWLVWCFCTGLMEAFTKFRFIAAPPKQSMLTWLAGQMSPLSVPSLFFSSYVRVLSSSISWCRNQKDSFILADLSSPRCVTQNSVFCTSELAAARLKPAWHEALGLSALAVGL